MGVVPVELFGCRAGLKRLIGLIVAHAGGRVEKILP